MGRFRRFRPSSYLTDVPDGRTVPSMNEQHMTTAEAAKVMGVSARSVRRWLDDAVEGRDYIRTPRGAIRIHATTVNAWANPQAGAA